MMKTNDIQALERFMADQWFTPSDVVELVHLYAKAKGLDIDAILLAGKIYSERKETV
jgi:hypothetical protein